MDKELKEYIASNKITDEQILTALKVKAEVSPAKEEKQADAIPAKEEKQPSPEKDPGEKKEDQQQALTEVLKNIVGMIDSSNKQFEAKIKELDAKIAKVNPNPDPWSAKDLPPVKLGGFRDLAKLKREGKA